LTIDPKLNICIGVIACVDLPALPLQLVWRSQPAWRGAPVVVIQEDRPQGIVLWACERARASGVLPGQRYAHALAICAGLHARVVAPARIAESIVELRTALHALSPSVEPAAGEPGTFWLDAAGMDRMFVRGARESPGEAWARELAAVMRARAFDAAIVVGYSRFASYAIARAMKPGIAVLRHPDDERRCAARVPLARLDLDATLREALARLGVTTVGEMVRLPAGGVLERFGHVAHRLYQLAAGERWDPLVPVAAPDTPDERVLLDDEDDDVDRLVFCVKGAIDRLLARLAGKHRALAALHVELTLKHAVARTELRAECIKPAAPTLDARALLRLLHLRLTGAPPVAPVNALRVWADEVDATTEQLALFAERPRRDLRVAAETVASLRAELGDRAVVRPVLRDAHLPEASFGWEPIEQMTAASPAAHPIGCVVRRIRDRPHVLATAERSPHSRDDGWILAELEQGAVTRLIGPYVISGGWWSAANRELRRSYHFADTARGDQLWIFFEPLNQRWLNQGELD
jgi:protein ImuB